MKIACPFFVVDFLLFSSVLTQPSDDILQRMDLLSPYGTGHSHGSKHGIRHIRSCQHIKYGNVTYSLYKASTNKTLPLVETKFFVKTLENTSDQKYVSVHYQLVQNPLQTFSVLEPLKEGTCSTFGSGTRSTVRESAKRKNCIVAANAGFFNINTGACIGNVVSDGTLARDSGGIQNVHFGITQSGYIFVGYLSEIDIVAQDFLQLVAGVIWLIRDGETYVEESQRLECPDAQTTGTLDTFVNVKSARTAVGHDKDGRVIMVQVDGKTKERGVPGISGYEIRSISDESEESSWSCSDKSNDSSEKSFDRHSEEQQKINLHQFAKILIKLGLLNAINLDSGGSTTTVINGTVVNLPSDLCENKMFQCERKVSTILCVHKPPCFPPDCSGHGKCTMVGMCDCSQHWSGPACDVLLCAVNCSNHGECTPDGCVCERGWFGKTCNMKCPSGTYGFNCTIPCQCKHGSTCNPVNGSCECAPGFTGELCEEKCSYGFYGLSCKKLCMCNNSCSCDHVTGNCNTSALSLDLFKASHCIAENMISKKKLVPDEAGEYRFCMKLFVGMTTLAILSIFVNICFAYMKWKSSKCTSVKNASKQHFTMSLLSHTSSESLFSSGDDDSNIDVKTDSLNQQL